MFCKNCGESLNDNQNICLKCGVEVGNGDAFCANCGKPIDPNASVCMECGVKVKKYLAGQDKLVIALVCFFLGTLGIHNFMMKETKKGVFKLILSLVGGGLTCGIGAVVCEVFVIIEFIKILTDKYVVDPNKLV